MTENPETTLPDPERFTLDLYLTNQFAFDSMQQLNECTQTVAIFAKNNAYLYGREEVLATDYLLQTAYNDYLLTVT